MLDLIGMFVSSGDNYFLDDIFTLCINAIIIIVVITIFFTMNP